MLDVLLLAPTPLLLAPPLLLFISLLPTSLLSPVPLALLILLPLPVPPCPPQSVASGSTHPHLPVQRQNQGYTQPATSGSSNNRSNVPIDPILLQLDRLPDMTEEEMAAWIASCESTRNRILRRYHGHGQGDDQGQL
jgi:hypothetical protein